MLDLVDFERVSKHASAVGAELVVVGVLYPERESGTLVASAALWSEAANGFIRLPPVAVDSLKLAGVAAFRLADSISEAIEKGRGATALPLDLRAVEAPARASRYEEISLVDEPKPEAPVRPERTRLVPERDAEAAPVGRRLSKAEELAAAKDPVREKKGSDWWLWALGGVGLVAVAGGTWWGVTQATKPVTGTVTATW
jgi:hypothetical protein